MVTGSSGRIQLLLAAALFSTGGVAVKACGLTAWQVAGFRCGIAAVALWVLLPAARGAWSGRTLVVACTYAVTLVSYVVANKATTAANAIFLQSSAPLYVLLLSPILLGERVRKRDGLLMAILAAGLGLLLFGDAPPSATAPDPVRGNGFGALAGVAWGATLVGLRWLAARPESATPGEAGSDALRAVVAGNVVGFVACLPMALPMASGSAADWLLMVYLGVVQIGVAYALLTAGMARVPALEASALLLLEPILTPVWAWLAYGEVPSRLPLLGGAVVLAAAGVKTWLDSRSPPGAGAA
ncbi:MAG: DMT family transporter [Acidobacteriota bacterium]